MANKVILFGSTGLIGRILTENMDVIPISRNECDLKDSKQLKDVLQFHKPDVVINCSGNLSDVCLVDNIMIHDSFESCKDLFGKLINFGSGAEFDRSKSIDLAKEESIFDCYPKDQYGLSKNSIARDSYLINNFYTLRLFGLLTEKDNNRFFSKIRDPNFKFVDRYFDYFSTRDLITVVDYFCNNDPKYRDVNLVYKDKYRLSDYVLTIYAYNKNKTLLKHERVDKNYTGCSKRLYELNLPLVGLSDELRNYKL